jgi:membrane-bound lytic murein transglycosylase A
MRLAAARWTDLPAWADDHHAEAAAALTASCAQLSALPDRAWIGIDHRFGRAHQWRRACTAVAAVAAGDDAAARAMFEREFAPWQVNGRRGPVGKMTAYFVQPLRASRTRHDQYQYPIYRRPPELVMIDWSKCSATGRGRKQWGALDPATGGLTPLPTRAEIRAGAFAGRDLELLWVDDPIDELFLRIEGSGRAILDDGSEAWVEYDGKNGQPYTGPARLLRARGELPRGQGTMAGIRAALVATTVACTGDDTSPPPIDAAVGLDGSGGDGPGGAIDAPTACVLPTTPITCADNTPCAAACGAAYCYNFMQVGMRCTMACTAGGTECPSGWTCNGMGRCRPPG